MLMQNYEGYAAVYGVFVVTNCTIKFCFEQATSQGRSASSDLALMLQILQIAITSQVASLQLVGINTHGITGGNHTPGKCNLYGKLFRVKPPV